MPVLRFWHHYSFEPNADYGYVDVSGDGGEHWQTLYFVTGHSSGWLEEAIDLSPYAYLSDVRIRFRLQSNSSVTFDGWYIDDVSIDETSTPTLSFPFFDDMEDEEVTKANWLSSSWELLDTEGHSGTHCWTDSPMGNSNKYTYSTLTLDGTLDLSDSTYPQLTFWHKGRSFYYSVLVQVSTDAGHNWTTIWGPPYDYNQGNWTQTQIDLTSFRNQKVRLRFVVDTPDGGDGWYIDDVYIDEAPFDVELYTPTNVTMHGADLSWSQNTDDDFERYEIYRDTSSSVSRSSTLIAEIEDATQTTYSDEYAILQPNYYWYRMYVVDTGGMYSVGSNPVKAIYHVPKVSYPFYDDMESGVENWEWGASWGQTTSKFHSEATSWTDSPVGNYDDNVNTALTTNIDLTDAEMPVLHFWHRYSLEPNYDFGYVDVSGDGGSNWTTLYFVTGHSGGWLEEAIDLSVYAYLSDVRIRFRLTSNGSTTFDGWYIDDVSIDETGTPTLSFPFFDDMEDEEVTKANWLSSSWELLDTEGHSGTHCWTDSPMGNSNKYTYSTLTLDGTLDLSDSTYPQLTFWHKGRSFYYSVLVQVSTDAGHNWTTIWGPPYDYNQGNWTQTQIDLTSFRNQKVRLRFVVDTPDGGDGWYIDDVYIGEDTSTMVDWGNLDSPASVSTDVGVPTENIYGLVYEPGITDDEGPGAGIIAQLGYGPDGSLPWVDAWTWVDATYDSDVDDKDKYFATLTVDTSGIYDYAYRYQLEGNSTWVYADLDGNDLGSEGSNGYSPSQAGHLTVSGVTSPEITDLEPDSGLVGDLVTIIGNHFGDSQNGSTITFNGVPADVYHVWSDKNIQVEVPEGATTGPVVVTVGGQDSNDDKIFTVIDCLKGDVNDDGEVKSNDAIICLKIAAGIIPPGDDRQFCAADMNCDGSILSNDAILILKKAAGFDVPDCQIITVKQIDAPKTPRIVRFKGISYKNGVVNLTIVANNFDDVAGADISLAYNPSGLSLVEITPPQGTTLVSNLNTQGKIKIAWVKLEDIKIDAIAMFSFKVIKIKRASLALEAAQLYNSDALPIPTKILHRSLESLIIPKDDQLLVNYPNPFNPDT